MFAYCENNPSSFSDSLGTSPLDDHPINVNPYVDGGYCENNPVARSDQHGNNWITDILDKIFGKDASENCNEIDHLIFGQDSEETKNIPFGSSTIGEAGCGVIALFNALKLLGFKANLYDIRDYFVERNYFRTLGTMPSGIRSYLSSRNIYYESSNNPSIIEKTKLGGVVIVTFWNEMGPIILPNFNDIYNPFIVVYGPIISSGAHTVAIKYAGGYYWVYNASSTETSAQSVEDYNDYLEGGFISGCFIP